MNKLFLKMLQQSLLLHFSLPLPLLRNYIKCTHLRGTMTEHKLLVFNSTQIWITNTKHLTMN